MIRVPVTSSNVASVGHEGDVLEVEFAKGGVYQYTGVSPELHAAFMASDSKGSFVHKHLKMLPNSKVVATATAI